MTTENKASIGRLSQALGGVEIPVQMTGAVSLALDSYESLSVTRIRIRGLLSLDDKDLNAKIFRVLDPVNEALKSIYYGLGELGQSQVLHEIGQKAFDDSKKSK